MFGHGKIIRLYQLVTTGILIDYWYQFFISDHQQCINHLYSVFEAMDYLIYHEIPHILMR